MVSFNLSYVFLGAFVFNIVIHAFTDTLKANKYKINLWQDQAVHMFQIVGNMDIVCWRFGLNKYYKINDGWFTYYVNISTGNKKFKLDKDDILLEYHPDDFWR